MFSLETIGAGNSAALRIEHQQVDSGNESQKRCRIYGFSQGISHATGNIPLHLSFMNDTRSYMRLRSPPLAFATNPSARHAHKATLAASSESSRQAYM